MILLNTLEELLDGIGESSDMVAGFFHDPRAVILQDDQIESRLRLRLGHAYEQFDETLTKMLEMLVMMRSKFRIDAHGNVNGSGGIALDFDLRVLLQVSWQQNSSMTNKMSRLKFVLSDDAFKEAFKEIDKANKILSTFTRQSIRLEQSRQKRRSNRLMSYFKLIRRQAASLYRMMVTGAAWICDCRTRHIASLRLESRSKWPNLLEARDGNVIPFIVIVSKGIVNGESGVWSEWRELTVDSR